MPTAHIKVGDFSDIDAPEGYDDDYTGPVPPNGLYRCTTKRWKLIINGSGDHMFVVLFVIDEVGDKSKFNGYAIWHNANITAKGAPYVNSMLDGLGINRKAVWADEGKHIVLSQDDPEVVVRLGKTKVDGLTVLVRGKKEEYPKDSGEWKLKAKGFAPAGSRTESQVDEDEAPPDVPDEPAEEDAF